MNRRLEAMRQKAFEAAFLRYMELGMPEDSAIDLAERDAEEGLQRYCDDKLDDVDQPDEYLDHAE